MKKIVTAFFVIMAFVITSCNKDPHASDTAKFADKAWVSQSYEYHYTYNISYYYKYVYYYDKTGVAYYYKLITRSSDAYPSFEYKDTTWFIKDKDTYNWQWSDDDYRRVIFSSGSSFEILKLTDKEMITTHEGNQKYLYRDNRLYGKIQEAEGN